MRHLIDGNEYPIYDVAGSQPLLLPRKTLSKLLYSKVYYVPTFSQIYISCTMTLEDFGLSLGELDDRVSPQPSCGTLFDNILCFDATLHILIVTEDSLDHW